MKNRILSSLLAALMLLSVVAVLGAGSFADSAEGLQFSLGSATVEAGTVAELPLYLAASALPATHDHLRSWQIRFSGAEVSQALTAQYSFYNAGTNTIGVTANAREELASAADVLGTVQVATVPFTVPAEAAGTTITVTMAVEVLDFEDAEFNWYDESASVATVAGTITVQAPVEPHVGDGEDFVIPAKDEEGNRVTTVSPIGDAAAYTGNYRTLTVPSCITTLEDGAIDATINRLVLKNTAVTEAFAQAAIDLGPAYIYVHKLADGSDTTAQTLADKGYDTAKIRNILSVVPQVIVEQVDGVNKVTFITGVAVKDADFKNLTITADFGVKTVSKTTKNIYSTITGYASTDEATALSQNVYYAEDYGYLAALSVKGVPTGTYTVNVTLSGTAYDSEGNEIQVVSYTVPVTVDLEFTLVTGEEGDPIVIPWN